MNRWFYLRGVCVFDLSFIVLMVLTVVSPKHRKGAVIYNNQWHEQVALCDEIDVEFTVSLNVWVLSLSVVQALLDHYTFFLKEPY